MRIKVAMALLAVVAAALIVGPRPASAHGNLDQTIEGDPGCNTSNFAASVTASGGQRQTFVPTGSLLSSVGLCVSAAASNTPLVVGIYGPGGLIGGGSSLSNPSIVDSAGPPIRYVHVDFLQPITVTAGALHTIEIQAGATLTWYGTAAGSPYTYCAGTPNTSAVGDFAFHTYLADTPGPPPACPAPPTATPPAATSTPAPQQPTNTSVPGLATMTASSTAAAGSTTSAHPTVPTGATTGGAPQADGAPPSSGGTVAGSNSGPSLTTGGQALPQTGTGASNTATSRLLAFAACAAFLAGSASLMAAHRRIC